MGKLKTTISTLLATLFAFSFVACKKGDGGDSSSSLPPIQEVEKGDGVDETKPLGNLCENGKTDYVIVYPAQANAAVNYAVAELATFFSDATGASLGIYPDSALSYSDDKKYISVGDTVHSREAGIVANREELNGDGFIMKTVGDDLYIKSANDRGILYGVYDFLERFAGVRFISTEVTHVPSVTQIPLYETNIVSVPAFEYRNLYSYSMRTSDELYARLRFNAPEREIGDMYGGRTNWYTKLNGIADEYKGLKEMLPRYVDFNVIHNAFYWVNPADYYDEHPEFFASDEKGNTIRDSAGTICQLNLTNGITEDGKLDTSMEISTAKAALESLKKFILDDPEAEVFFFGHNDWAVYDLSPASKAAAEKYGGQSGILMRFVNVLSDEINKWLVQENIDRKVQIATWAYLHTKEAPVKEDSKEGYVAVDPTVIPRENIIIRIAPIELDWYYSINDPNQLQEYSALVTAWTYITKNFMFWTYETNFGNYLFYYPSMRQWADNVRYFESIGTQYLMLQDNYHGFGSWQAELHTYVASKLLWDTSVKVQPLIDEFLYYYFGEQGAKAVAQMMQLFDDQFAYLQAEVEEFWMPFRDDDGSTLFNPEYFPISLLAEAETLMKEAIAANEKDTSIGEKDRNIYARNLTSALLTPQFMILRNYSAYYSGSKTAYAAEVIKNAEYVGVMALSEVQTLINYKAGLGLS